jgi:hypothetical protein
MYPSNIVKCTHLSFLYISVYWVYIVSRGSVMVWFRPKSCHHLNVRLDIIENSMFILCKHLEYYYLYCIPSDREVSTLQTSLSGRTKPRRLQGNCVIYVILFLDQTLSCCYYLQTFFKSQNYDSLIK